MQIQHITSIDNGTYTIECADGCDQRSTEITFVVQDRDTYTVVVDDTVLVDGATRADLESMLEENSYGHYHVALESFLGRD